MTYRQAAEAAHLLCCSEDIEIAQLGMSIATDLAEQGCYLAKLTLVYVYSRGGPTSVDKKLAMKWAQSAKEMHGCLSDAADLYDAGLRCMWDEFFQSTRDEALELWLQAAALGNGEALYAYCDATRHADRPVDWSAKLERAAELGSMQAMVELSEQPHVRGTSKELLWLRAAVALGSLRAKELLQGLLH
ncbi:hypothetical protein AVHY2522_03130 [Acidovorax sp. SUPP2522]|uniref:hypothetical protein n=1 Tax=unclassified Acidovorax TaxID=2684926 RepID=UPI00234A96D7|nr:MULTISPECIES: hypothetical protein [unclassified Acidovorax]WCM98464.1 hypothetical protein M5C96_03095 [Acidovorax sp. GBBC 1281]GKT14032.1 hypothetical protein AVHY2522_03130 [Acidovorax sp. SUPP2522]